MNILRFIKRNFEFIAFISSFVFLAFLFFSLVIWAMVENVKNPIVYENPYETITEHKEIDVVVLNNFKNSYFAKTHHYKQKLTVKSEGYGIEKTFNFYSSGAFMDMPYWRKEEGETLKATLYIEKIKNTGEITKLEINNLN